MKFSEVNIDARYFGFIKNRAIAASLFARTEGASQEEVNNYMRKHTDSNQEDWYNMLDKANQWGHEIATWDDPKRGKVFKLKYNIDHSAKTIIKPPENWRELNKCTVPIGVTVGQYIRKSK